MRFVLERYNPLHRELALVLQPVVWSGSGVGMSKSELTRWQLPFSFFFRTETCKMYISDEAVKCDNKILFNPVTYILIFVRFHGGEITPRNTEAQLKMVIC